MLRSVVLQHCRTVLELFLNRFSNAVRNYSVGLLEVLEQGIPITADFSFGWDIAFGKMHHCVVSKPESLLEVAALVGLRLSSYVDSCEWFIQFYAPKTLIVDRLVLSNCTSVAVRRSGDDFSIEAELDGTKSLISLGSNCASMLQAGCQSLSSFEIGNSKIAILPPELSSFSSDSGELANHYSVLSNQSLTQSFNSYGKALTLISECGGPYSDWINHVLRYLAPIRVNPGLLTSKSRYFEPGVLYIACIEQPEMVAEMIVHEASHQYLNIVQRLGPLDDGSDDTLYYSPFRREPRPIKGIITAYHAAGNMLLFFRECNKDAYDKNDYFLMAEQELVPQVLKLETAWRKSDSLTEVTSQICCTLAEKLNL